ncbi:hypothetical protein [Ornithobacterium rhinotracheale]|uniref:hypothetical protein n=1 Tax=Ornithobacterium rhinotracheale TaxID=28251 RepID=UPI001FF622BA|nr:hypothetical protein [Ornithobacterium rhinotracheale]MCK0204231.1 hypothetical protein [Ornithobacterium rhinotracheale]
MKKTMLSLGVFALVGLSTVYGQSTLTSTTPSEPLQDHAVGVNTDKPYATLDVDGNARVRVTREANLERATVNQILVVDKDGNIHRIPISDATLKDLVKDTPAAGGGTSPSTPGGVTLNTITGNIRVVNSITESEWEKNNTFALVQTSEDQIRLPKASNYTNRIIAVNNQYNNQLTYFNTNKPKNASAIDSGKGHLLMSDGINWYIIGGSY